jgi:hypothetical protein
VSTPTAALALALAILLVAPATFATPVGEEGRLPLVQRLRDVVELRLGSEPLPQQVDPLGRRSHAEVMLSLPLSDSLRLRGGTRVQLLEQPAANRSELEAQPRLGIQLRF